MLYSPSWCLLPPYSSVLLYQYYDYTTTTYQYVDSAYDLPQRLLFLLFPSFYYLFSSFLPKFLPDFFVSLLGLEPGKSIPTLVILPHVPPTVTHHVVRQREVLEVV